MSANPATEPNRRPEGRQLVVSARGVPVTRDPYGPPAGYPTTGAETPGYSYLEILLEIWRIVYKRKWLVVSIAAAFFAVGAVRTLMKIPLYTATVRLQIDANVAKIVGGDSVMPIEGSDSNNFMRTQYELLKSRNMAERVVSTLALGDDLDFLKPRELSLLGLVTGLFSSSPSDPVLDGSAASGAAVGVVMGNVGIQPVMGSRLVDVSYSDTSPTRAQHIANGYADAFMAANLDKRFQANASAKTFLEDKIQQLKLRLEESEKRLLAFAQDQQIVDVNDKASIAESNLAAANAALGNLIAERTKNEQLWRQAGAGKDMDLPQLLSDPTVAALRAKRKDLAIEYQEKLQTFKPDYPAMVQIKNQLDEIDRQLAGAAETIKGSLKGAYEASLAQEQEMQKRIETLKQDVLDLQKRSIQYNILKREVDTNRDLYTSLLQRYKEVDVASGIGANNVFVVDRAGLPGGPSSPDLFHALLMSLAIGLGTGLGAAYLLERLDNKVRSVEQLELASGLTTLGVIPSVNKVEEQITDPRSPLNEAFRSLCTALQFATDQGLPRTITITSAGPGEGKSLTSIAVAKHFASLGRKVLLVDADLRNPSLHQKLKGDNENGLSNYLAGACTPPEVMQKTEIANLAFIASGPLPPNAADLLGGPRLLSLLSIGCEVFDLILIDGPPVLGLADAQLLSSASSATVFVVAAGSAKMGAIRGALKRLQLSRANLIGAVLTKYDAKRVSYGYGYGEGHEYRYEYSGSTAKAEASAVDPQIPQLADLQKKLVKIADNL
jgi:succinoglycan biosynthesis transport protein ExoP